MKMQLNRKKKNTYDAKSAVEIQNFKNANLSFFLILSLVSIAF